MKIDEKDQLKQEVAERSRVTIERANKLLTELAIKTASLKKDVKLLKGKLSDEVTHIQP